MFKKLGVDTRREAILLAKKLCRCERLSFQGVQWHDGSGWEEITWEVIDTTRPGWA